MYIGYLQFYLHPLLCEVKGCCINMVLVLGHFRLCLHPMVSIAALCFDNLLLTYSNHRRNLSLGTILAGEPHPGISYRSTILYSYV